MIKIYDNVFSKDYLINSFGMVRKSNFQLGWVDSDAPEHSHNVCLHSMYSDSDIDNFGILRQLKNHDVKKPGQRRLDGLQGQQHQCGRSSEAMHHTH